MKLRLKFLVLLLCVFFLSVPITAKAADYIVSGAGIADANGLYVEDGTSGLVPKYTKGIWSLACVQPMGSDWVWVIRNGPLSNDIVYINFLNPPPDLPPNDGGWLDEAGSVPDLTITLSDSIPTLNEWGLIMMCLLLSGIAFIVIKKGMFRDGGAAQV